MLPEQIAERWDFIKPAIENSLPLLAENKNTDRMNNVLECLLLDKLQCWVTFDKDNNIKAVTTTRICFDDISMTYDLLMFSTYTFSDMSRRDWLTGLKTLNKFAKSRNCSRIVAYTDNNDMVRLSERLGWKSKIFLYFVL